MILGCKVSGVELCQDQRPEEARFPWAKDGLLATVAGVAALHSFVTEPNDQEATGAYVVVGAGNAGFRGRELTALGLLSGEEADGVSMVGTFLNAVTLARHLRDGGVPHQLMRAPNVEIRVPGLPEAEPATPAALAACFRKKRVPVIGFGSGKPGQSTDSSVIDLAEELPEPVQIMKATKHGYVCDGDPATNPSAARLAQVAAPTMIEKEWFAVDAPGLRRIISSGMPMMVHGFGVTPSEVFAGRGTLILPNADAPLVYA